MFTEESSFMKSYVSTTKGKDCEAFLGWKTVSPTEIGLGDTISITFEIITNFDKSATSMVDLI